MKNILSTFALVLALIVPATTQAYFVDQFNYAKPAMAPQYVPDPSLDFLPGWPDWIGRLNIFAEYVYGRSYRNLNESQQKVVEKLSKNWPDWIGVPFYMQR